MKLYTTMMIVTGVVHMGRYVLLFVVFFAVLVGCMVSTSMFDVQPKPLIATGTAVYEDVSQPLAVRVADLLSYMTLEEKIGQMTLVENNSIATIHDISTYHLGALLSGAGSKPTENTLAGWKKMITAYQAEAKGTRLGIPLLYGVDAIHGHAHVGGVVVFPHAINLGATHDEALVTEIGRATAEQVAASGANWNFAPNLDQPKDIRWGRVYEGFSDDTELVAKLGVAYLEGLQTPLEEGSQIFVLGTLKHYLGLGDMGFHTSLNNNYLLDQGVTKANNELLESRYLPPFKAAIDAGALSVMVGLNTWGEDRMVRQKNLLTKVLKDELDFKGFVVSDWYGVHEGRTNIFAATVAAVNAGVDMVMLPFDYKTFARHMLWANRLGLISDARIDDAAGRILYAKFALGLFDKNETGDAVQTVPEAEQRALARRAVTESMVLLKNDGVLPIKPTVAHIKVAGSAANNIGRQMGAWSLEWQGFEGNDVVGATSILAGIKAVVSNKTNVEYDALGNFSNDGALADVGIAVVGEKPYAEGWGDKEFPILDEADLVAIQNLQQVSKKVVVVLISGRPLLISNEIDSFAGLVAAWLPGSEGEGVADALFGVKPFTGTLPLPWPARAEQLPLGESDQTADDTALLFPRFFGLVMK